jgi:hypothetical protein
MRGFFADTQWRRFAWHLVLAFGACLLLIALVYQVPVRHTVDIGHYDAAYVQGFEPALGANSADLHGSDSSARWGRGVSYLLFPQIGAPSELHLHARAAQANSELVVLLNGTQELGRATLSHDWQDLRFAINGGLLKPNDIVIELRGDLLLDSASLATSAWPITPYPAQLAYAGIVAVLLSAFGFSASATWRRPTAIALAIALVFLLFHRLQLWYPYPIRWLLPYAVIISAALVFVRYAPLVFARWPRAWDIAALASIALWAGWIWLQSRQHVVLSLPGVENDFGVFARRSVRLWGQFQADGNYPSAVDGVLRADGFYNLGYPLVLWLVRPLFAGNPFLAAQSISLVSAVLFVAAAWWIGRIWLGRAAAWLVVLFVASSGLLIQYALYIGTDMLFAACALFCLAVLSSVSIASSPRHSAWLISLAGALAAGAFLIRHPGIVLLAIGALWLWWASRRAKPWRNVLIFVLAFVVFSSPQLLINMRDTGQPLFSQQAKNIWLCVYADCDWGRWDEVPNSIPLRDVLLQDPPRFVQVWLSNLRSFVGTGAEDTSEFGRAIQLRLLNFPANWLGIAGLLGSLYWLLRGHFREQQGAIPLLLLAWLVLYTLPVSVGLLLPRFFLVLTPVYALAAVWLFQHLFAQQEKSQFGRFKVFLPLLASVLVVAILLAGSSQGAAYVLKQQDPDEVAAIGLVQSTLGPDDRLEMQISARRTLGQYSAIAHLVVPENGSYLLAQGAEAPAAATWIGTAGPFTLYQLEP